MVVFEGVIVVVPALEYSRLQPCERCHSSIFVRKRSPEKLPKCPPCTVRIDNARKRCRLRA
ncbi:hypothetical protein D3C86_2110010 [compost metagenome]